MFRFTDVDPRPTRLPLIYKYRTYSLVSLRQALEPIFSQIGQLDEFIKIAMRECYYPSEHGLTLEESASIYIYTMDWGEESLYRKLSQASRAEDRLALEPWYLYMQLFDTALTKLPNFCGTLWRGVDLDVSQNYRENTTITWQCFSSCSTLLSEVEKFLGSVSTLFMINTKNGKDISDYSKYPEEKEVILGLSTRLKVASNPLKRPALNIVHLVQWSNETREEQPVLPPRRGPILPTRIVDDTSIPRGSFVTRNRSSTNAPEYNYSTNQIRHINNNDSDDLINFSTFNQSHRYEREIDFPEITPTVFRQGESGIRIRKDTYRYPNGNTYTGEWLNNKKDGHGTFTWPGGDRYEVKYSETRFNC